MRYPKHLFIRFFCRCAVPACLALLCAGFAALGGCTDEADGADGPSPAGGRIPLSLEITADGFTGQPDASLHTRASEQDNYDTKFAPGDAIGLFAVKNIGTADAAIVDDINNTKFTFASAAEASLKPTWQPADATTLYYYADVTYIAYYPYKDGITIDPTQSKDAILASFAGKTELQPAADQSTPEAYGASDLMTAGGTATDTSEPNRKLLTLTFTHSYSLIMLKINRRSVKYMAPDGTFNYHPALTILIADVDATDMTVWDIKARKKTAGVFHAIVKNVNGTISGSYVTGGMLVEFNQSPTGLAYLGKGKRYECTVNTPVPGTVGTTERPVKVGDFYFMDGTIWPGGLDGVQEPPPPQTSGDGSLGVVFWTGNPAVGDADTGGYKGDPMLGSQHPKCTHGLVLYKGVITYTKWAEATSSIDYWVKTSDPYPGVSFDITTIDACQGYANTQAMKKFIISTNSDNVTKLNILTAMEGMKPTSANTSGWYVPSLAEASLILNGKGKTSGFEMRSVMSTQLGKLYGGFKLEKDNEVAFWTSTEKASTTNEKDREIMVIKHTNNGAASATPKSESNNIRVVLAF